MVRKAIEPSGAGAYLSREVAINRYRDILIFIPFLAATLFLSPVVEMASHQGRFLGLPFRFWQIYLTWVSCILVLRWVNKKMKKSLEDRGDFGSL